MFFETEMLLDQFALKCSGDVGTRAYVITKNKMYDGTDETTYNDTSLNRLIGIEFAGHHGRVTLLTREFGRGVDYQVEAKVVEQGGMHVIQTFFSVDVKEEVQIKGRTARKDDPGSYELILCLEHLKTLEYKDNKFDVPLLSESSTYADLDSARRDWINKFCSNMTKTIESNSQLHQKTMEFYRRALTTCNESNRIELIKEINNLD